MTTVSELFIQMIAAQCKRTETIFKMVVDYTKPFSNCHYLTEFGGYDCVDMERFWLASTGKSERVEIEMQYVTILRTVTTEEVLNEMEKCGLRPANFRELMTFDEVNPYAVSHPEYDPIVALGVSQDDVKNDNYTCICRDEDGCHHIKSYYRGFGRRRNEWNGKYVRFLAVRKESEKAV